MRNLKKILALALSLVMMLSVMSVASAKSLGGYSDAASVSAEYEVAVDVATQLGVLQGMTEDTYAPQGTLTRAQLATMIYRITTGDVAGTYVSNFAAGAAAKFSDVSADAWYAGYVGYCADAGYLKGMGDGTYAPNATLTGYQALAALLRAIGYNANNDFTGADWTIKVSRVATQNGMASGVITDLNKAITREQAAQFIYNALFTLRVSYTPALGYQTYAYNYDYTLAWDVFDIASDKDGEPGETIDKWGRPGTVWYTTTDKPAVVIADEAINTYNTAVTECTLAVDLGLADGAYVDLYDNYKYASDYHVDPLDVVTTVGGQGTLIEVYADRIVKIDTYLAQVQSVVPQMTDAAGHIKQYAANGLYVYGYSNTHAATTQAGAANTVNKYIDGNTYAAGTMILISINNDGKTYIDHGVASSVVGTQSTIWYYAAKHTVNGVTYDDAAHLKLNEAGSEMTVHTWYFDQYNNLIGATDVQNVYDYAVLTSIWWSGDAATGSGKALGTLKYMDGTTATVAVAAIEGYYTTYSETTHAPMSPSGKYFYVATNAATNVACDSQGNYILGHLMQVATYSDGSVALSKVVDAAGAYVTKDAHAQIDANVYNKNGYIGALRVDTTTVFMTYDPVTETFVAYNGINEVPSYSDTTPACDYVLGANGVAKYVYIYGTPNSAKSADYVLLTSQGYNVTLNQITNVYELNLYTVEGSVTVKTVDASIVSILTSSANLGKLYYITYTNGFATGVREVSTSGTVLADKTLDLKVANASVANNVLEGDSATVADYRFNITSATVVVGDLSKVSTAAAVYVNFSEGTGSTLIANKIWIVAAADEAVKDPTVTTVTWTAFANGVMWYNDTYKIMKVANGVTLADVAKELKSCTATFTTYDAYGVAHTTTYTHTANGTAQINSLLAAGALVTAVNGYGVTYIIQLG